MRNVARLAELPTWQRKPIAPWTATEARTFLEAAKDDQLYPAFMLLLLYGLRRGEVLVLRWHDVDEEDSELRVRQHIQRIHGELRIGRVKTVVGRRDLPLLDLAAEALETRRAVQATDRAELGRGLAGHRAYLHNQDRAADRAAQPSVPRQEFVEDMRRGVGGSRRRSWSR